MTVETEKNEKEPSPRKGVSRRVLVLVSLALFLALSGVLLVVAEWAVRNRERNRVTVPSNTPSAFYRHQRLGSALIRNQDYYGWFKVNSHGLRGDEIAVEAAPGTFRIMVVGGSTTFDGQVTDDDKTWPKRLEHWLREGTGGERIEVINAGMPGYTVFDNLVRLQLELFQFGPDLILLYHAHNDVGCGINRLRRPFGDRPFEVPAQGSMTRWLERNSELYNKVVSRWQAIASRRAGRARVAATTSERPRTEPPQPSMRLACGPEQFDRDVTAFVTIARNLGAEVAIGQVVHASGADAVTEPDSAISGLWALTRPYVEPDSAFRVYVRYRDILRDVAEREGVTFIPTGGFGIEGMEYYGINDPMHFNDAGADLLGRGMAGALLERGLVATPATDPP